MVPYTKAKEKFFPVDEAGPTEVELLTEIRDALASQRLIYRSRTVPSHPW